MLDKILIIDFEDSFTYNIASTLFPFEQSVRVVEHRDFFNSLISDYISSTGRHGIILGPGPGHPNEYRTYFKAISRLRKSSNLYVMGICLGHQIMGLIDGKIIKSAREQIHGQAVELKINARTVQVQRYNSLAVYENDIEIDYRAFPRGVSYQFHPESVGTKANELFFKDLLTFVQ